MKAPGKLARLQNTAKPPTTQLHLCTLTLIRHSPRSLTSPHVPLPFAAGERQSCSCRSRTDADPNPRSLEQKGQRPKAKDCRRKAPRDADGARFDGGWNARCPRPTVAARLLHPLHRCICCIHCNSPQTRPASLSTQSHPSHLHPPFCI